MSLFTSDDPAQDGTEQERGPVGQIADTPARQAWRNSQAVAWIGLGNMGGPMAANLVRAGYAVQGFDLSQAAADAAAALGVTVVDSVKTAVADAEVVFTMLPRGEHVQAVLTGPDGVLAHALERVLAVDSSMIDIELARELHRVVRESGRRFLDAPCRAASAGRPPGV